MIKAILFDADGVVIKARTRFFSDRFAEKQGVPVSEVIPFFKNEMRLAFLNRADIRESVKAYLPRWNWKGSADDFLSYWFGEESPRNEEVLKFIDDLRSFGIKCYIATDREKYWGDYLIENVGLKNHFDGFMFSYDIGYEKHVPEYFLEVLQKLSLNPNEVMYFDDDQKNVDVAKSVGLNAHFYVNLESLKEETRALFKRF